MKNKIATELVKIADEIGENDAKAKRIEKMFKEFAKEELDVQIIKGTAYAFGSELATLRLLKKYRDSKKARQDYSANMRSWYFSLDV